MKPAFPGFGAGHGVLHGSFGLALRAAGAGAERRSPSRFWAFLLCLLCSAPVRANETLFKWLSLSRSCQCLQFRISSPEKPPRASPPLCASLSVPAAARACPASLHPHSLHQNSGYSPGRSHQFLFSQLCLPGEASQGRKPWLCFTQAAFSDL